LIPNRASYGENPQESIDRSGITREWQSPSRDTSLLVVVVVEEEKEEEHRFEEH
jgi:hypothetical protein